MTKGRSEELSKKGSVKRFARLPEGEITAHLIRYLWTRHTFDVRETNDFTEFVIRLPYSKKLKNHYPGWYAALLGQRALRLRQAALPVYREGKRGDKVLKDDLDNVLFQIFERAIETIVREGKSLGVRYEHVVERELKKLVTQGRKKRGPKRKLLTEHRRAVKYARSYEAYHALIKMFQKQAQKLETRKRDSCNEFQQEVRRSLPYDILRRVLERDKQKVHSATDLVKAFTSLTYPHHLTLDMQIELTKEERPRLTLTRRRLLSYVREGKRLIEQKAPIL